MNEIEALLAIRDALRILTLVLSVEGLAIVIVIMSSR